MRAAEHGVNDERREENAAGQDCLDEEADHGIVPQPDVQENACKARIQSSCTRPHDSQAAKCTWITCMWVAGIHCKASAGLRPLRRGTDPPGS